MNDRGDDCDSAEELHFIEIDGEPAHLADGSRQSGGAGGFERRRLDHEIAEIESVAQRRTAEQHKEIRLAWRWHEQAHAECCHGQADGCNRLGGPLVNFLERNRWPVRRPRPQAPVRTRV
ncbi:MAG: hypothetical protein WD871_07265 [Xanthobacteraceae bacterium]